MEYQQVIDDIVNEIELHLDQEKLNQASFHVVMLDIITRVMNVVEILQKDKSGKVKKYIVIKVGEKVVEKHFPNYMDYYRENAGLIIELVIQSYYMLKESKVVHNFSKCCFPCFKKKE